DHLDCLTPCTNQETLVMTSPTSSRVVDVQRHLESVSAFHARVVSGKGCKDAQVDCAERLGATVQHMRQVFEEQKKGAHALQGQLLASDHMSGLGE
ncbi:unnamed protein product, partial [Amoebophrya sp. A25]